MNKLITVTASILAFTLALGYTVSSIGDEPPIKPQTTTIVELNSQNLVFIDDQITGDTIAQAQDELSQLLHKRGSKSYPIFIAFRSPGGDVDAGLFLYEFLKTYSNVHTIMIKSYSMAAVLPQLISGQRLVTETSTVMFHRIKLGLRGYNDTEDIQRAVDETKSLEDFVETKISNRAKMSLPDYRKNTTKDWFLNAEQAIKHGFADKVVVLRCHSSIMKYSEETIESPFPGLLPNMKIRKSKCPIAL